MNVLLDTHILIWSLENNKQLTSSMKNYITNADIVYVSTVSLFEAAIKIQLKKLIVDMDDMIDEMKKSGFEELPLLSSHAKMLSTLPRHHGDQFDRMLVAQAIVEPLHFLTADKSLMQYSELVITA